MNWSIPLKTTKMKKKNVLITGGSALFILFFFILRSFSSQSDEGLFSEVKKGKFIVDVMTSGSLDAKNSVKIPGPKNLRTYRI